MPLLGLVGEAHELPNQGFIDPVTLHYLGVDVQCEPRIGVPDDRRLGLAPGAIPWREGRAFRNLELVAEDPSAVDRELARLRAKAGEQEVEIARLRDEAAAASGELAQLGAEAGELHRRELDLSALVGRLQSEARVHEDVIARLRERLAADELELNDLRAVRNALTPPELASRPGVDLAASFLPATEGVSGDFYLVADGPHEATALVVGDVVGKGLEAARRAAFIRTVFATTAPFSDDPGQLLSWANTALFERAEDDRDFVTVGCVTYSPRERVLRWGYAGHPQCSGWTPARS